MPEPAGGAVPLGSPFYLERPEDALLRRAVARGDSIVLLNGSRQVGKIAELNRRHHSPLATERGLDAFSSLLGGHPYPVRRGLHELVARPCRLADLETFAGEEDGPFADHLRLLLLALSRDPDLCAALRRVLEGGPPPSTGSFYRLRSAGLPSGDAPEDARSRCRLYRQYFRRHLP